ncbi:MAG TPA: sensor histidine kinase [Trebonia sp.]
MDVVPVWRDRLEAWWSSPVRNALYALGMAALLTWAAYEEAHPTTPNSYFPRGQHAPYTPVAAYLLVVAACLPLAFRRRWPAAVLVVSTAAVAVYSLLGYVNGAALVAPMIALYSFACQSSARRALVWGAGMLAVLMAATLVGNPFYPTWGGFDVLPFAASVACFAGIAVGNRRAYVTSIKERAEADARRRIDEERLRIARELHDVVAHTMATINVQASAAAQVLATRPEQAAESLTAIRAASKEGLRELRAILNVLRQADEVADPTQPAPGLTRLDALAAGVRQAGLPVTVTVSGRPRPVPTVTDLAAFRIVQEALTNTIRHAGPATATVSLCYGDEDLRIEVADTGRGPHGGQAAGQEGGHGLRGMRERASAAGGELEVGEGPSGGFRVAARFPLGREPRPAPAATSPVEARQ